MTYKLVAKTLKPHWGKAPNKLPKTGPYLFDFVIIFWVLLLNLCSTNSIIKKAINKNGNSFIPSIKVSFIISIQKESQANFL